MGTATDKQSRARLPRIPVLAVGISLSIFLVLTYLLCIPFLRCSPICQSVTRSSACSCRGSSRSTGTIC